MLGALIFLFSVGLYFSKYRYLSVFLLFVLVTGCFQLLPLKYLVLSSAGVKKTYDWVLLLQGAVFLVMPQYLFHKGVWKKFCVLIFYAALLVLVLLYSIFFQQIEISVSIRVFRSLLFFITIFLFVTLSIEEMQKVFRLIIIFTSIASMVYCLQTVMGVTLLNNVSSDSIGYSDNEKSRYYNLPVYAYPVIFFLFFSRQLFAMRYRMLFLMINGAAIILTQHRNLILAVLACYLIFLLINYGVKMKSVIVFCIIGAGLYLALNSFLGERFSQGFQDVSTTSFDMRNPDFYNVKLHELSTTEFRRMLLAERMDYILQDGVNALLGIGMLTDDSRKAGQLNFNIGMSDGYGNVAQVASSDIAWSTLLLQIGLLGIMAFMLFHFFLMLNFFDERKNVFMQVGFLYIICLMLTSFYSNNIVLPYVTSLLMLFAAYHYRLVQLKRENGQD